jgi:ribosomal protein L37AE/L43A
MTSINDKMGLKRPGKRDMMKLPRNRGAAAAITAARCPQCDRTGARVSRVQPGDLFCSWCNHRWTPEAVAE